jgi:hypothetical protein
MSDFIIPPGYPDDVPDVKFDTGYNPTPGLKKVEVKMTEKEFWLEIRAAILKICAAIERYYLHKNVQS